MDESESYDAISITDVAEWLSTQGVLAEARTMGEFSILSLQQTQDMHLEIATSSKCTRRRIQRRCCNEDETILSFGSEEDDYDDEDDDNSGNSSPTSPTDYFVTTIEDKYLKLEEDLNSPSPSPSPFHSSAAKATPTSITMLVDLGANDTLLDSIQFQTILPVSDVEGHYPSNPTIPSTATIPSPSFEIVPSLLCSTPITPPAHAIKFSPSPIFNPSPSPSPSVVTGTKRKSASSSTDQARKSVEVKVQDIKGNRRQELVEPEMEPEDLEEDDGPGGRLGRVIITRQRHLDSRWPVPIKLIAPFAATKWFKVSQEVDECPKLKEGGTWYESPIASNYSPYDIASSSSSSYEEVFLVISEDRVHFKERCCSKQRCHFSTSGQPLISFQTTSTKSRYFQLNENGETQLRVWLNLNPSHGTNGRGSRIYMAFFKRCPSTRVATRLTSWTHVENTRKRARSEGKTKGASSLSSSGTTISIKSSPPPRNIPTNVASFAPPFSGFHFPPPSIFQELGIDYFSDRMRNSTITLETEGIEQFSSEELKTYSSNILSTYYHQQRDSTLPFPLSLSISPELETPLYLPDKCEVVIKVLDIEAHGQKVLELLKNLMSPPSSSSSSTARTGITWSFQQLPVLHHISPTTKIVSSQVLLTAMLSCIQEAKCSSNPLVLICPWILFQAGEPFERLLKLARSIDSLLIVGSSSPYKEGLSPPSFIAPAGCADVLTVGATDRSELFNSEGEKDEWSSLPLIGERKHFAWLYNGTSSVLSTSAAATIVGFHSALLWLRNWDLPASSIARRACSEINSKSAERRTSDKWQENNEDEFTTVPQQFSVVQEQERSQEKGKEKEEAALYVQKSHSKAKLMEETTADHPQQNDRRFIRSRLRLLFLLFLLPSIIFAIFCLIPPETLRLYLPASIAPSSTSPSFGSSTHTPSSSPAVLLEGSHFTLNLTHYGDEKKPTKRAKLKYFFEDQFGKFKDLLFARKKKRTTIAALSETYESSEKFDAVLIHLTKEDPPSSTSEWKEVEEVHLLSKGPNHLQIYTKPPMKNLALDFSLQEALVRRIVLEPSFEPNFASHYILRWACLHGQMEVIRHLKGEGAGRKDYKFDPSVMDQEPLQLAIKGNHLSIVKLLLEDGRTDPVMSLNYASSHGRNEIVRELLSNYPGVNPTAAILHARSSMKNQTIDLLLEDSRVNPIVILNFATSIGDYELANKVISKVPTSARGFALMAAKATNIHHRLKLYKGLSSSSSSSNSKVDTPLPLALPPQVTLEEVWAENQETSDKIGEELAKLRWQMEHFASCSSPSASSCSASASSSSTELFSQEKEGCSLKNLEALFEKALAQERRRDDALVSLWQEIVTIKAECEKPQSPEQLEQLVMAA